MYQDQQSIKVFERQHARDRLAGLAHDLADAPDTDIMTAHTGIEALEWRPINVLAIIVVAVLVGIVLGAV
jgi:hypothetical protein